MEKCQMTYTQRHWCFRYNFDKYKRIVEILAGNVVKVMWNQTNTTKVHVQALHILFTGFIMSKITYALPAFTGQLTADDRNRICAISRKDLRHGVTHTLLSILRKSLTVPNQCHYFTLWIKRSSCIKMHNVITDDCKKSRPEYQLTTVRMSELKAVLEMTTTRLHTGWKTSTPLMDSCSNDGVIQLGPLSSDAMFQVVEISDVFFTHLLLQDAPHTGVNRI